MIEHPNLTLIEADVAWPFLFEGWAEREEGDSSWQACARGKGWENWRTWRAFMAQQFGAPQRRWDLYRIIEPNEFIPKMRVGPFQGPQKVFLEGYKGELLMGTFEDAARLNGNRLKADEKIEDMIRNFPLKTEIFGIHFSGGGEMCMEGSHRSLATAIASQLRQSIDFSGREVRIALTEFTQGERKILVDMLKRGSEKSVS